MEPGSIEKLKFDKRLRLRQGWSSKQETDKYLEALPDVSEKIAVESDEPEAEADAQTASETDAPDALPTAAPDISGGVAAGASETQQATGVGLAEDSGDSSSAPPFKEV